MAASWRREKGFDCFCLGRRVRALSYADVGALSGLEREAVDLMSHVSSIQDRPLKAHATTARAHAGT